MKDRMGSCTYDLVGSNVSCLDSQDTVRVCCPFRALMFCGGSHVLCFLMAIVPDFPGIMMAVFRQKMSVTAEESVVAKISPQQCHVGEPPAELGTPVSLSLHLQSSPSHLHEHRQHRHAQPRPRPQQDFYAPQRISRPPAQLLQTAGWALSRSLLAKCLDCPRRPLEVLSC